MKEMWFQQDGTTAHRVRASVNVDHDESHSMNVNECRRNSTNASWTCYPSNSATSFGPQTLPIHRFLWRYVMRDSSFIKWMRTSYTKLKSYNYLFLKKSEVCRIKCFRERCRALRKGFEFASSKGHVIWAKLYSCVVQGSIL